MSTTTNNPVATERKRKFLLVLPLLVFPFLTFLLWSVGLLSSGQSSAQGVSTVQHGFNMHLPDAKPKDHKSWNKLDYYSQADLDSAKLKEALQRDLYYKKGLPMLQGNDTGIAATNGTATTAYHFSYDPSPSSPKNYHDPNVEKVNQQLAKLKAVLNQPPEKQGKSAVPAEAPLQPNISMNSPDINRLENIVQSMHQKDSSADPEMQQLNGMMDKLLDIQHPERVKERIREQSQKNKQQVFPVVVNSSNDNISLLQSNTTSSVQQDSIPPVKDTLVSTAPIPNAFYSLDDNNRDSDERPNAIEAVVQETQTLVSGATVKLRLVNEVYINGVLIPKDNFIYGMASLNGERLNIGITTIRYQNNILQVALSVYDMDGLSGIYIPGAITRDVAKQSADESLQGIGLTTLDPSISAQAASAGIQAAKTLISKKVKLIRVTVKAGYRVLLRDTNQK
jgi:conjugative transposon TraM protein